MNNPHNLKVLDRPCVYIISTVNVTGKAKYSVGFAQQLTKRLEDHTATTDRKKPKARTERKVQSYKEFKLEWVLYVKDMKAADLIYTAIDMMENGNKQRLINGESNRITYAWIESHKQQNTKAAPAV